MVRLPSEENSVPFRSVRAEPEGRWIRWVKLSIRAIALLPKNPAAPLAVFPSARQHCGCVHIRHRIAQHRGSWQRGSLQTGDHLVTDDLDHLALQLGTILNPG